MLGLIIKLLGILRKTVFILLVYLFIRKSFRFIQNVALLAVNRQSLPTLQHV